MQRVVDTANFDIPLFIAMKTLLSRKQPKINPIVMILSKIFIDLK